MNKLFVPRERYIAQIETALRRSPVVALLGPRQCGKTTLARMIVESREFVEYFDLESPADQNRLENPDYILGRARGLVVIDEIQIRPDLFSVLRVLADRGDAPARFLILGSASPTLIKGASETLAGRVEFVDLHGFSIEESGADTWERLWIRGGFPRSFLAGSEADSMAWREGFIRTFLQRDLPEFGIGIPAATMRRFWAMLAHYHGRLWNSSELARALGVSDKSVRGYLDILTDTFMVRQLQPWFVNIGKRQVKAPKVYLRDTGLLHALLWLPDHAAVVGHPVVGLSWEGFALEQILRRGGLSDVYFWATHGGAELDLFFMHGGRRFGVEIKFTDAPAVTRSMRIALQDLQLDRLWIVAPVETSYELAEKIEVCPSGQWRLPPV